MLVVSSRIPGLHFFCHACLQPVVEEVLLKQLVNSLYTQEEHVHDHVSPEENEARELDAAQIHQETACNALTEVMAFTFALQSLCQTLHEILPKHDEPCLQYGQRCLCNLYTMGKPRACKAQ